MIDEDIKQRIKVVGIFFLQSYKILMGTMRHPYLFHNIVKIECAVLQKIIIIQKYLIIRYAFLL